MQNQKKNNEKYFSGLTGEKIAQQYMEKLGFVLLKNRFKTKNGEIDLIFKNDDEKLLVFMEVKRRKTVYDYENVILKRLIYIQMITVIIVVIVKTQKQA